MWYAGRVPALTALYSVLGLVPVSLPNFSMVSKVSMFSIVSSIVIYPNTVSLGEVGKGRSMKSNAGV